MPSGSKKRKSSKKPKPHGGPPELDVGLEEAMANTGEEVGEPSPSPVGIEGDPEAMAETGFDSNEVIGKTLQEVAKEDFQLDEADRDTGGQGDPPPLAEPEPEIPAAIEAEPPAVIEPEAETVPHQEIPPQIDTPFSESDAKNDATPEEIKAEKEYDAGPVDLDPVVDATPDAPLDEIKPDADIGLDEIESSKENPKLDREFELDAAPLGSESGIDKSFVDVEPKTDATSTDIEPESGKAADELVVAAAAEDESGIGERLVKEGNGPPYIAQETDEAPNEVQIEVEPEPHTKPEAEIEGSETEEGLRETESVTEAAPTDVETEGEEKQVEEPETAAPIDIKPEGEEKQIEEPETAARPDIEPVAEEAPIERELDLDAAPVAEVEEAPAERELASDVPIADVEPETEAAPVDIDAETKTTQAETDALQDEVPQEIDAAIPKNKTETDVAVREFEPEEDAAAVKPEPSMEVSPVEIEPEVSAEPVSIEAAPEPELQEEPEVNAEDVAAPDPEPEGEALVKEEPEVCAEDVENSAEIEARTAPPEETEPEPRPLDLAEDTSFEPSQAIEPELEAEEIDKAKLEDEASVETKAEEPGSVEMEACQQDSAEGEGKVATEMSPEAEVETTRGIELEAEAVVSPEAEPESAVEAPVETVLDEKGLIDTEADQQDLAGIGGSDQSGGKEEDGQLQTRAGEPETHELESSASDGHQPSESQPLVADASVPVVEDEPPAISAELKEGDSIPPLATDLEGEGESTMEVVSENQDSQGDIDLPPAEVVNAEELAKEDGMDQEREVDVGHGEDEAVLASAGNGGEAEVLSEQELGSEQPLPADVADTEECVKEEPPVSDQELVFQQPQPLVNLDSVTGEPEKDIGEEEAASSTKAEAGSVLNDSDERASYELELPTDFPLTEQVADVPDIKEFDDNMSTSIPEFVETGSRELDREPIPAEKVDTNIPSEEEATSEQPEVLLESAEAAEPAKDIVFMENAGAAEPANDLHPAPVEEIPSDEQVPSLPQPVRQDSGKDEDYTSREVALANEEPKAGEEEGAARENDDKVAANSTFPNVAGDALISKAAVHLENGKQSLASSEAPSNGVVENGAELGIHQGELNNTDKAEIDAVDSKESKEVEVKPAGADDIPVDSAPPISEGRDIKDFEAFHQQESTPEASLPVVISSQDRNVEVTNLKNAERPSQGGVLKRRTKFLDCCGMFDLLLKKN